MNSLLWESLIPIAFIVLGCVFLLGRGARLISGYNTMPRAERERYDRRALCRFMGKMMFYTAGCLTFVLVGDRIASKALFVIGFVLLFAGVAFMLIYANTGGRFLKKH